MRSRSPIPAAFTLPELILVITIIGIATIAAVTQVQRYLDRLAARSAVAEAALVIARAREESVAQHTVVTILLDTVSGTVTLRARGEQLALHAIGHAHGVHLSTTRDSIAFDPRGLGYGAANTSVIAQRGAAANTLVVSRLGRTRY